MDDPTDFQGLGRAKKKRILRVKKGKVTIAGKKYKLPKKLDRLKERIDAMIKKARDLKQLEKSQKKIPKGRRGRRGAKQSVTSSLSIADAAKLQNDINKFVAESKRFNLARYKDIEAAFDPTKNKDVQLLLKNEAENGADNPEIIRAKEKLKDAADKLAGADKISRSAADRFNAQIDIIAQKGNKQVVSAGFKNLFNKLLKEQEVELANRNREVERQAKLKQHFADKLYTRAKGDEIDAEINREYVKSRFNRIWPDDSSGERNDNVDSPPHGMEEKEYIRIKREKLGDSPSVRPTEKRGDNLELDNLAGEESDVIDVDAYDNIADVYGYGIKKNEGATSKELDSYLSKIPGYLGTFLADDIDDIDFGDDSDNGKGLSYAAVLLPRDSKYQGHWVGVIVDNKNLSMMYYDPLAEKIPSDVKKNLYDWLREQPYKYQFKYNAIPSQDDSDLCGFHVIRLFKKISSGIPWKEATNFEQTYKEEGKAAALKDHLREYKFI